MRQACKNLLWKSRKGYILQTRSNPINSTETESKVVLVSLMCNDVEVWCCVLADIC